MRAAIVVLTLLASSTTAHAASPAEKGTRLVPDLRVLEFAMCPDGRSLVVRGDASVVVVDWPGGAARPPAAKSELPPCAATALGFSADGRLYARPAATGTITILDVATAATRTTLTGHVGTVGAVAFSPDGKWLASGGLDNDVRIWNVTAGTCVRTVTSPTHAIFSIVWAPDGQTFYTAGASRTVTAWSATGEPLRESPSLGKPINVLALSADGRRLVAGTFAAEGTNLPADVRVLDAATFAERRVLPSPDGGSVGLAFSPDGQQLLWASSAGKGIVVTALEQ